MTQKTETGRMELSHSEDGTTVYLRMNGVTAHLPLTTAREIGMKLIGMASRAETYAEFYNEQENQ